MNEGTLCAMHQTLAIRGGSFWGERTHFMTVAGAWCVASHSLLMASRVRSGKVASSLLSHTGLLGRTLGEEGFVLVPV
ncbi:hypothetical protein E2C01_096552 [Portunus trituberculatus]|uniref:Uncharacterized protein n=1 Tax=Portunus trituberculatus TaxID=210409 RepID=A0A5B7JVX4_PORTR|nr:hypothetical protein [Portunus trituberculatus]